MSNSPVARKALTVFNASIDLALIGEFIGRHVCEARPRLDGGGFLQIAQKQTGPLQGGVEYGKHGFPLRKWLIECISKLHRSTAAVPAK